MQYIGTEIMLYIEYFCSFLANLTLLGWHVDLGFLDLAGVEITNQFGWTCSYRSI